MIGIGLLPLFLGPAWAAAEVPLNGVDEDGDGSDGIRVDLWATFPKATAPFGWSASGGGAFGIDKASVTGAGHVQWTGTKPFLHGDLFVGVDVDSLSGSCNLTVDWQPLPLPSATTSSTVPLSMSTDTYEIPMVTGPLQITKIKLGCGTFGSMTVDWVTVQNGDDAFPPPGDVDVTWTDIDVPLGGYETHTTLRGIHSQSGPVPTGLLAATDVGGVAVWEPSDGQWEVRNGTWPESRWQDQDLNTWDIAEAEGGEWISVTGVVLKSQDCDHEPVPECIPGPLGQLLVSDDQGLTWVPEADTFQSLGTSTPAFATARRVNYFHNSDGTMTRDMPGGRLVQPAGSSAFLANHIDGSTGLVLREDGPAGAPTDLCELNNLADPAHVLPSPDWHPLPDDRYENVISALAWIGDPGDETLLVGYRLRDTDGTTSKSSLFRCDFSGSPDPTCAAWEDGLTCYEVADGLGIDVSDIEVTADGVAYVSDYGRRPPDGAITGAAVYRWDVSMTDKTGASDAVVEISPSAGFDYSGNISSVTGLLVGTDFLYAFTPGGRDNWYSEKPRLWRIPTPSALAGTSSAWITLSENDAKPTGELERDTRFVTSDTWADDQVGLGNWANVNDGVFYGSESTIVGAGEVGVWAFDGVDAAAFDGHLGPNDDDDPAPFGLHVFDFAFFDTAAYGDITAFQATVAERAEFASDGRLHVAAADMGYYRQDAGDRSVIPPQVEVFTASGTLVDVVPTRQGSNDAVWVAASSVGGANIGIWRSADNGESWCYQAGMDWPLRVDVDDNVQFVGDHYDLAASTMSYDITGAFPDWPACDQAIESTASDQGLAFADPTTTPREPATGTPMAISALDEDVAVVGFQTSDYGPGGIAYTLDGAATWDWLAGPSDTGCLGTDKFAKEPILHLVQRYDSTTGVGSYYNSATDYRLEMFFLATHPVTSEQSCLWRGVVTPGSETWTAPINDTAWCSYLRRPEDFAISPWDDTLVLWGGFERVYTGSGSTELGGACLLDFDATVAETVLDPNSTPNTFGIGGMVPHPWIKDYWFVTPVVDEGTQRQCVKERLLPLDTDPSKRWNYEWDQVTYACEPPIPFALLRSQGVWVRAPLSIAGLSTLFAMDVSAREAPAVFSIGHLERSVELGYSTHGSGVFRGTASW